MKHKSKQTRGFFDEEFRLGKLTAQKDPLIKLAERIDSPGIIRSDEHRFENGIGK